MSDAPAPGAGPHSAGAPFVLALGSNVGNRRAHLAGGLRFLSGRLELESLSRVVESDPWGPIPQRRYLNMVVRGRTELDAFHVLELARAAELLEGRVRGTRFGPRTLDVDLILFGDLSISGPPLTLPHPRWQERPFVYGLLPDVAADMIDPLSGRRIAELVPPGPLPEGLWEVEPMMVEGAEALLEPTDRGPATLGTGSTE